jgi:hypothetical protein
MTVDLTPLRKTLVKKTGEEESVRPALLLSMYSDRPVAALSPAAASALRAYLDLIPNGALRSCANEQNIGPLTPRRISRDLKHLDNPAKNEEYNQLYYSSSENGPPGDYGISFLLDDFEGPVGMAKTNLLKFEFPWNDAEGDRLDGFIQRISKILSLDCGISAATVGFGFSHLHSDRFAFDQVLAMLPRYLGFDHSAELPAEHMRGRTPVPSWITFLNEEIMAGLGGEAALRQHAPRAELSPVGKGFLIRAAKYPPVGDGNRGAEDLGELPGVARFLKPKRVYIPFLRGRTVELDVTRWCERLDSLENRPWENR